MEFLILLLQFVPVWNVGADVVAAVNGVDPNPWGLAAKLAETVAFLQLLMPVFERFTMSTANTWDDGIFAKAAMILAFLVEIVAALGAIDPQIGRRIKAITGPRKTRP